MAPRRAAHRRLDVTLLVPRGRVGVVLGLRELGEDRLGAHVGVRSRVPGDLEGIARLHRGLVGGGHHRHQLRQRDRCDVALHPLRPAVVHGGARGALSHGRIGHLGVDHVRQERVHAEFRLAGDLVGDVEPGDPLAHDAIVGGLLERDLLQLVLGERLRDRNLGDDLTVSQRAAGRHVPDHAPLGDAVGRAHVPRFRGCVDQRQARGGAGARQRVERPVHRPAPAGEHEPVLGIVDGVIDANVLPVRLELLGHDLRQRGADTLPHLGLRDVHGDEAVGRDGQRGVRVVGGGAGGLAGTDERKADRERGAGGGGRCEERSARHPAAHDRTPCAARLIARLILR